MFLSRALRMCDDSIETNKRERDGLSYSASKKKARINKKPLTYQNFTSGGRPSHPWPLVDGSIPDSYNPPISRYESAPLEFREVCHGEMA